MTDKKIKELKRELERSERLRKFNLKWAFVFLVVSGILMILLMLFIRDNVLCEQQLAECQEKVPVWVLRVYCNHPDINYYGMRTFGYNITGEVNYSLNIEDYDEYLSVLEEVEDDKYCEVIK